MLEALIILFLLSNAYICSEELNSFTSNKLKVKSKLETSINKKWFTEYTVLVPNQVLTTEETSKFGIEVDSDTLLFYREDQLYPEFVIPLIELVMIDSRIDSRFTDLNSIRNKEYSNFFKQIMAQVKDLKDKKGLEVFNEKCPIIVRDKKVKDKIDFNNKQFEAMVFCFGNDEDQLRVSSFSTRIAENLSKLLEFNTKYFEIQHLRNHQLVKMKHFQLGKIEIKLATVYVLMGEMGVVLMEKDSKDPQYIQTSFKYDQILTESGLDLHKDYQQIDVTVRNKLPYEQCCKKYNVLWGLTFTQEVLCTDNFEVTLCSIDKSIFQATLFANVLKSNIINLNSQLASNHYHLDKVVENIYNLNKFINTIKILKENNVEDFFNKKGSMYGYIDILKSKPEQYIDELNLSIKRVENLNRATGFVDPDCTDKKDAVETPDMDHNTIQIAGKVIDMIVKQNGGFHINEENRRRIFGLTDAKPKLFMDLLKYDIVIPMKIIENFSKMKAVQIIELLTKLLIENKVEIGEYPKEKDVTSIESNGNTDDNKNKNKNDKNTKDNNKNDNKNNKDINGIKGSNDKTLTESAEQEVANAKLAMSVEKCAGDTSDSNLLRNNLFKGDEVIEASYSSNDFLKIIKKLDGVKAAIKKEEEAKINNKSKINENDIKITKTETISNNPFSYLVKKNHATTEVIGFTNSSKSISESSNKNQGNISNNATTEQGIINMVREESQSNAIGLSNKKYIQARTIEAQTGAVARDQTGAVARDQAGAVARDQTGAVARDQAGAVARDQTGAVARDQTGAVARDQTGAVSRDQTGAVSRDQTGAVSRDQTGAVSRDQTGADNKKISPENAGEGGRQSLITDRTVAIGQTGFHAGQTGARDGKDVAANPIGTNIQIGVTVGQVGAGDQKGQIVGDIGAKLAESPKGGINSLPKTLSVDNIPGLALSIKIQLKQMGITTVEELKKLDKDNGLYRKIAESINLNVKELGLQKDNQIPGQANNVLTGNNSKPEQSSDLEKLLEKTSVVKKIESKSNSKKMQALLNQINGGQALDDKDDLSTILKERKKVAQAIQLMKSQANGLSESKANENEEKKEQQQKSNNQISISSKGEVGKISEKNSESETGNEKAGKIGNIGGGKNPTSTPEDAGISGKLGTVGGKNPTAKPEDAGNAGQGGVIGTVGGKNTSTSPEEAGAQSGKIGTPLSKNSKANTEGDSATNQGGNIRNIDQTKGISENGNEIKYNDKKDVANGDKGMKEANKQGVDGDANGKIKNETNEDHKANNSLNSQNSTKNGQAGKNNIQIGNNGQLSTNNGLANNSKGTINAREGEGKMNGQAENGDKTENKVGQTGDNSGKGVTSKSPFNSKDNSGNRNGLVGDDKAEQKDGKSNISSTTGNQNGQASKNNEQSAKNSDQSANNNGQISKNTGEDESNRRQAGTNNGKEGSSNGQFVNGSTTGNNQGQKRNEDIGTNNGQLGNYNGQASNNNGQIVSSNGLAGKNNGNSAKNELAGINGKIVTNNGQLGNNNGQISTYNNQSGNNNPTGNNNEITKINENIDNKSKVTDNNSSLANNSQNQCSDIPMLSDGKDITTKIVELVKGNADSLKKKEELYKNIKIQTIRSSSNEASTTPNTEPSAVSNSNTLLNIPSKTTEKPTEIGKHHFNKYGLHKISDLNQLKKINVNPDDTNVKAILNKEENDKKNELIKNKLNKLKLSDKDAENLKNILIDVKVKQGDNTLIKKLAKFSQKNKEDDISKKANLHYDLSEENNKLLEAQKAKINESKKQISSTLTDNKKKLNDIHLKYHKQFDEKTTTNQAETNKLIYNKKILLHHGLDDKDKKNQNIKNIVNKEYNKNEFSGRIGEIKKQLKKVNNLNLVYDNRLLNMLNTASAGYHPSVDGFFNNSEVSGNSAYRLLHIFHEVSMDTTCESTIAQQFS